MNSHFKRKQIAALVLLAFPSLAQDTHAQQVDRNPPETELEEIEVKSAPEKEPDYKRTPPPQAAKPKLSSAICRNPSV